MHDVKRDPQFQKGHQKRKTCAMIIGMSRMHTAITTIHTIMILLMNTTIRMITVRTITMLHITLTTIMIIRMIMTCPMAMTIIMMTMPTSSMRMIFIYIVIRMSTGSLGNATWEKELTPMCMNINTFSIINTTIHIIPSTVPSFTRYLRILCGTGSDWDSCCCS